MAPSQIDEWPDGIVQTQATCLKASNLHEVVLKLVSGPRPKLRSIFYVATPYKTGLQDAPKLKKNQFFVAKNGSFGYKNRFFSFSRVGPPFGAGMMRGRGDDEEKLVRTRRYSTGFLSGGPSGAKTVQNSQLRPPKKPRLAPN
jgi:hypothetical protein